MSPQPGTAGTDDDPLDSIATDQLVVDGEVINTLVGLAFDSADQTDGVLRFDGTGSTNGITDGSAKVIVGGTVYDVAGAEWVDLSGTRHTVDSWEKVINAQFNVSITGTNGPVQPGNTLDVTVDVSNAGTDQDTQTVTLDIDNGVGQADSTSVTLSGGGSTTQTLSWSVPSGQTKQDYQATVSSADDTASQTVTVGAGLTIDDFESYNTGSVPSPYTAVNTNSNAGVVTTDANSGSQSLNIQGPTGTNGFEPTITQTFAAATPDTVQVTYYETTSPSGGAIRWLDSSGEELCAVGSGNPGAQVVHGGGNGTVLASSPSPNYEAWRRFTVTPDFANGTFDVLWEDIDGTSPDATETGLSFVGNPSDVAEIQFGGDKRPGSAMGANGIGGTFLIDDSSSLG